MPHKFTRFKIVIKNLFGGRLAWVVARRASEERKVLAREEIVLVPDERTGFFFEPCKLFLDYIIGHFCFGMYLVSGWC